MKKILILIFWVGSIKKGQKDRLIDIRDIAPKISLVLGVCYPNGCTGQPIIEITK